MPLTEVMRGFVSRLSNGKEMVVPDGEFSILRFIDGNDRPVFGEGRFITEKRKVGLLGGSKIEVLVAPILDGLRMEYVPGNGNERAKVKMGKYEVDWNPHNNEPKQRLNAIEVSMNNRMSFEREGFEFDVPSNIIHLNGVTILKYI